MYALVANIDDYHRFIPFVTTSRVLSHEGRGQVEDRPWLDDSGEQGEIHRLKHEMKIGVMGFDESWISNVTAEKFHKVEVSIQCFPYSTTTFAV